MVKRSRGKKDANQPQIDRAAKLLEACIIPCSQYPTLGFDRIYVYKGRVFFTEIKNPSIKDPVGALTEVEKKRRLSINWHGGMYIIVQTPEDLADSFGVDDETWERVKYSLERGLDSI